MTSRTFRAAAAVGAAALLCLPWVRAAGPGQADRDAAAARLLRSGRNAEALGSIEAELQSNPQDPVLLGFKVKALMGLGRFAEGLAESAPAAALHPEWPVLRLFAGDCALVQGKPDEAIRLWSPLLARRDLYWADDAAVRTVKALIASGRREEARAVLDEALSRVQEPSMGLLVSRLSLARSGTEGLAALSSLQRAFPSTSAPYLGLGGLYAAVGHGELLDEPRAPRAFAGAELKKIRQRLAFMAQSTGTMGVQRELYIPPFFSIMEKDTGPKRPPFLALQVSLDGAAPKLMILDSGSPSVLLTDQTADALGLAPVARTTCAAVSGGTRESPIVLLRAVDAAGLHVANVPALLIPHPSTMRRDFAGIVPLALFERHAVLFEPKAARMALLPSGTRPEDALGPGSFAVSALWVGGRPLVLGSVECGGTGFFLVDTGAGRSALSRRQAQLLREGGARGSRDDLVESVAGVHFTDSIARAGLGLGPVRIELTDCPVMELQDEDGIPCLGILGLDVLSRFRVLFDYSRNVVAFKANPR